ncbi:MAG: cytochrome c oxidase subunit 3 [Chloroflexi bacterium]|nr:cytochrome c oxidase subunit 3 [Chloroflexota bacterium]
MTLDIQFESLEHQHETRTLGMWIFLMTELMLFGGLFTAYIAYRYVYPTAFVEASHHLHAPLGTLNTAILITSSLTMALAVHNAQLGKRRWVALFLVLTIVLGSAFLGIKGIEYTQHYWERLAPGISFEYSGSQAHAVQLFFLLYFAMTGLHAIHLTIGIVIVAVVLLLSLLGRVSPMYWTPVELTGLYWHFVDVIWVFLFPLLYLIR